MIDEINSTELHTCLLEITLLPLAHYWHFWYGPLDAAIYGSFILGAKILWHIVDLQLHGKGAIVKLLISDC